MIRFRDIITIHTVAKNHYLALFAKSFREYANIAHFLFLSKYIVASPSRRDAGFTLNLMRRMINRYILLILL